MAFVLNLIENVTKPNEVRTLYKEIKLLQHQSGYLTHYWSHKLAIALTYSIKQERTDGRLLDGGRSGVVSKSAPLSDMCFLL